MTRTASLALLLVGSSLCACSAATSSESSGGDMGGPTAPYADAKSGGEGAGSTSGSRTEGETGTPSGRNAPQAGQLTAGVWDDNLNFDFFKKYLASASSLDGLPAFTEAERNAARALAMAPRGPRQELDLALVFDTTGSMGDELGYLQLEFQSIVDTIHQRFPQTTPRVALVFYRDKGDAYVTQKFDFTTDAAALRGSLKAQSAGGGGDYPEAVADGLDATMGLGWRGGDVARLAFWVADAPHHVGEQGKVRSALDVAVQKGVKLFPVAASGTDARAEFTMRSAAQITGGRYLFLTDDSGIGNSHAEPHIPCYQVTRLDQAIVRMASNELTGQRAQPAPVEVLRTVGNPTEGKCVLQDKDEVVLY